MELMEPSSVKRLLDNVRFVIDSLFDVVVSKGVIVVFMMLIFSVGKTILLLVLVSVSAAVPVPVLGKPAPRTTKPVSFILFSETAQLIKLRAIKNIEANMFRM